VSSFSLHEWLQSEQSAGTFESEGEFTIAQSKAWEKLGAFQLPFPEAWVLKLVQAALIENRGRVAVVQSREETRFSFRNVPDWTSTELEKAIFDTQYKAERSVNHLAIAVRALALQRTRPFALQYADGSQVAWNGSAFTPLEPERPSPGTFTLTVTNYQFDESKLLFSTGNSKAARFRADVVKALVEHCHLSGFRITLDTRPLERYWTDPDFGQTETSHPLAVLKAEPVEEWDSMVFEGHFQGKTADLVQRKIEMALPKRRDTINSVSTAVLLSCFYRPELLRKDMHLDKWFYHPLKRRSRVLWYSDGVIVSREALDFEATVGIGLIVSAHGLPTDLTGFNPLDGPEKKERVAGSLELIRPRLSQFKDGCGEKPFSVKGLRAETVVSGFIGAGVAFALPLLGVPWVVSSGYQISKQVKENNALQTAFNEALNEMFDHFCDVGEEMEM
jgi:hypothetical protein